MLLIIRRFANYRFIKHTKHWKHDERTVCLQLKITSGLFKYFFIFFSARNKIKYFFYISYLCYAIDLDSVTYVKVLSSNKVMKLIFRSYYCYSLRIRHIYLKKCCTDQKRLVIAFIIWQRVKIQNDLSGNFKKYKFGFSLDRICTFTQCILKTYE